MNPEQARLSISLLGSFRVTLDGEPVTGFVSDKARALLAYLAVEADRPHRRERLAGLLWPDYPEREARGSLRTALNNLRRVIGDREADPKYLDVTRQEIQFNRDSDSWVDVLIFSDRLAASQASPGTDAQVIVQLEEAVVWYQGDFLEGFAPADCMPFEEWALTEQESLRRRAWEALERLVAWYEARGEFQRALPYARRQVDLDPLQESAHRHVMRLLALGGERAAALKHYEVCCELLQAELGVGPDEKTARLYEQIRAGDLTTQLTPGVSLPPVIGTPADQGMGPSLHSTDATLQVGSSAEAITQIRTEQLVHGKPPRLRVATWILRGIVVMGLAITLIELLGLSFKGLRFLGGVVAQPELTLVSVVVTALLIWAACGYVVVRRQRVTVQDRSAGPAFGSRERVVAGFLLVLNAVVTLLLIFGVLRYDVVNAQSVDEGQLGIVVAEFGQGVEMKNSPRGRELSAFVARSLRRELDLLPGLADKVTIISGPLVGSEEHAVGYAAETGAALVIWGWVPETIDDTFVPSFTFAEIWDADPSLSEVLPWHEVEISAGGTLELSQTVARRTSGLIEYVLGLVYLNQGEYDTASMRFQEAISLAQQESQTQVLAEHEVRSVNRSLAVYHLALGRCFAAQGDAEQARAAYETALDYDSLYGRIYIGIGNISYSERRCVDALQWYERAVQLVTAARKPSALYSRGNAHYCLQQYELAAADYQEAIRLANPADPSSDLYHLVLGVTLCWLGRFSEGIEEIQQAQTLAAQDMRAYRTDGLEWCWAQATAVVVSPTPTPSSNPAFSSPAAPALSPTALMPAPTATSTSYPTVLPTATLALSLTEAVSPSITPTKTPSPTLSPPPTATPIIPPPPTPTSTPTPTPTPSPWPTAIPGLTPTTPPPPTLPPTGPPP